MAGDMGQGGTAESVCLEAISPCFALFTIDLFGWLVRKKNNQIIDKLNGGLAVTMGSITDRTLALLAFG